MESWLWGHCRSDVCWHTPCSFYCGYMRNSWSALAGGAPPVPLWKLTTSIQTSKGVLGHNYKPLMSDFSPSGLFCVLGDDDLVISRDCWQILASIAHLAPVKSISYRLELCLLKLLPAQPNPDANNGRQFSKVILSPEL